MTSRQKKKTMKTIILLIINLLIITHLLAKDDSDFEDSKVFTKAFKSTSDFELEITNKHGNVSIETWDKDSVFIEATIKVETSNLDRLESMLDNINIDFSPHTDYLAVTTEWNDAGKGIKNDILKIFGEQSVNVNYKIKVPGNISVDINNKYGNVEMVNFDGKVKLDVSHGDINVRNLTKLKTIKLKYGKLKAKKISTGDIYARFSKIRIDEVDNIDLDCASSEIEIEQANRVVIKSLSDEIEIENVNTVQINATFSDIEIEKLETSVKGNIKHGNIDIDLVNDSFSEISLNGQNTDIELNFTVNSSFEYFVQLEKGESFIIPSSGNNLKADNSFDNIHQYEGTFAKETFKDNSPKIRIIAKHSFVQFDIN